jgi:hypothetical protein
MRLFDMAPKTGTWVPVLRMPRSIVSVVALCTSPNFADPPFFGLGADADLAQHRRRSVMLTLSAAARSMNSRHEIRPFLIP